MKHKLGICIPYRNRGEHLKRLVPHLSKHLSDRNIEYKFYVAHQVDDKLLNRGALKNVAAKYALEDGCDYVAWHDVDMLPHDDCDYSYPIDNPIHIATKLSKYKYGLSYDQYFGGVVLFTKKQIEDTNGYSNEYWDWGQEDDDLFWRANFEGYTTGKEYKTYINKKIGNFNGNDSYISIPSDEATTSCLHNDHTISLLFKAGTHSEKNPLWLVGDKERKFIEYPLIRKDQSYNWGLSFNNSRAITMFLFGKNGEHYYNWGKRFENLWTWVTMSYSKNKNQVFFYINDELICQMEGVKQNIPYPIQVELADHDTNGDFLIGYCSHLKTYYKGKIGEVKIYNKFFENVEESYNNTENLVLYNDFEDMYKVNNNNVELIIEDVNVIENILPYRREGKFLCLEHENEGFANGKWVKGETTARNEKRLVTEMQQRKIDYKNDGINNLKYELINVEDFMDNCVMINIKL